MIDACFRLHNFIVEYRLRDTASEDNIDEYSTECLSYMMHNPDTCVGVYGNGSAGDIMHGNAVGRPSLSDIQMRNLGVQFRDSLKEKMKSEGLKRMNRNWRRTVHQHTEINEN